MEMQVPQRRPHGTCPEAPFSTEGMVAIVAGQQGRKS
jgi:hypothetical protein